MIIPESVRINGMEYKVDYVNELNDGRNILKGQIEPGKHIIHINPTEENDYQDKCLTFLHEVLHAICYEYSVKLKEEEKVVEALSRGIFQILEDNKERMFLSREEAEAVLKEREE